MSKPGSIQLAKLNIEYRPAFSALISYLKSLPFKIQLPEVLDDVDKRITNPELKKQMAEVINEIYGKTYNKVKLLEPLKVTEEQQNLFYVGNLSGDPIVPSLIGRLKSLKTFKWNLNVIISNTMLSRILRPEINLHFEWEEGGELSLNVTLEQFQVIRKAIASILLRIHSLECIKQIDL